MQAGRRMNRLYKLAFDGQDTNIPPVVAKEYYSPDAVATEPTNDTRHAALCRRIYQDIADYGVKHRSASIDWHPKGLRNNGGFVGKFTPNPNYSTLGIGPLGYVRFSGDPVTGWANWHYANQRTGDRKIPYNQFLQDTNYMWEQTQRARAKRWGVPYDKNKTYVPLHRKGSKYFGLLPLFPLPLSAFRALGKVYPKAAAMSKPSRVTYTILSPGTRGFASVGGLPGALPPGGVYGSTLFHEGVASGHHASTHNLPGTHVPSGSLIPGMLRGGDSSLDLGLKLAEVDGDGYPKFIDPAVPESVSSYYSHIAELSGLNDRLKKMLIHNGYKAPALKLAQPPAAIGSDRVTDPLSGLVATGAVLYDPRTGYYSLRSKNYSRDPKFEMSRELVPGYDLRSWLALTNRVAYLQRRVDSGYANDKDREELQYWKDTLTDNYEVH